MASSVLGGSLDKVRKDSAPKDGPLRPVLQLDHAVNALRRDRPAMSAGNPLRILCGEPLVQRPFAYKSRR